MLFIQRLAVPNAKPLDDNLVSNCFPLKTDQEKQTLFILPFLNIDILELIMKGCKYPI